jgi:hypothetical protein
VATLYFTARTVGAERVLRQFALASAQLPADTLEAQREIGKQAEVAFAAFAPHRSGRLSRGMSSTTAGGTVTVRDEARNPATGYDYVGVTRFGHRVARIYPKHRSFGAAVISTKNRRGGETLTHGYDSFNSQAALRFVIGGRVLYRKSVAAYHPDHDWSEDALPDIEARADVVAAGLGRKIETRIA